jgi:hypothetical protein
MADENQYVQALREIAGIVGRLNDSNGSLASNGAPAAVAPTGGCRIMQLPPRLHQRAAATARATNPVNAPLAEVSLPSGVLTPQRLTLLTTTYWGAQQRQLSVSFLDDAENALQKKILDHMNAWSKAIDITFALTQGVGDVRISFGSGGFYSYLGTDIKLIPSDQQTMNLEGFSMSTADSEFFRVVRHETGHTLGFPHEHMRRELIKRIDPQKAYPFFLETQGWDKAMVDAQVLTPLDEASIRGTATADQDSIMCYQLPGSITFDGQDIRGGTDIDQSDYEFASSVYPKIGAPAATGTAIAASPPYVTDWDPAKDVVGV